MPSVFQTATIAIGIFAALLIFYLYMFRIQKFLKPVILFIGMLLAVVGVVYILSLNTDSKYSIFHTETIATKEEKTEELEKAFSGENTSVTIFFMK